MDLNAIVALDFQVTIYVIYNPNGNVRNINQKNYNYLGKAVVLKGESSPSFPRMCSSSQSSDRKNGNISRNQMKSTSQTYLGRFVYYLR